jgi:hypothetical protein
MISCIVINILNFYMLYLMPILILIQNLIKLNKLFLKIFIKNIQNNILFSNN